jgi:hypothetical protein
MSNSELEKVQVAQQALARLNYGSLVQRLKIFIVHAYAYSETQSAHLLELAKFNLGLREGDAGQLVKHINEGLKTYDGSYRSMLAMKKVFDPYKSHLETKVEPKYYSQMHPGNGRPHSEAMDAERNRHSEDIN